MHPQPDLFQFSWPIDQDGYEFATYDHTSDGIGATLLTGGRGVQIRPKGGAPRFYRPLAENRGLYRQFAETVVDEESASQFVHSYGMLSYGLRDLIGGPWDGIDFLDDILKTSENIREICKAIDGLNRKRAAEIFNLSTSPIMRLHMDFNGSKAIYSLVPQTLRGALYLQVAEEISKGTKFRRCKTCQIWFPYGPGTGNTARKEFCSNRCRVAHGRRQAQGAQP